MQLVWNIEGMSLESEQVKATKDGYRAKLVFVGNVDDFDYYPIARPYIPEGNASSVKSQDIEIENLTFGDLAFKGCKKSLHATFAFGLDENDPESEIPPAVKKIKVTVVADLNSQQLPDTMLAIACELNSPCLDLIMTEANSDDSDDLDDVVGTKDDDDWDPRD